MLKTVSNHVPGIVVELPGEEGDALGGRESDGRGRVVEVWVRMSSDDVPAVK